MSTTITKNLGYFAASHNLPSHDGGCWNLHGHNYGVSVTIGGNVTKQAGIPYSGMIIDFTHIKTIYKEYVHAIVDHAHIFADGQHPEWYTVFRECYGKANVGASDEWVQQQVDNMLGKVAHLPIPQSTAEYLASWVLGEMQKGLDAFFDNIGYEGERPYIVAVEVTETESSIARVEAD